MSLQSITISPAQPSAFDRALVAAEAVGELYQVAVDFQSDLTPETRAALVRAVMADWRNLLGVVERRVSRMQYRMLVMLMLGHASTRHDDIEVRRELKSCLLPEDERCEVWRVGRSGVPGPGQRWVRRSRCSPSTGT